MYKCTECGTEYDVKPEYCDCGNDTFEEIVVKPVKAEDKPSLQHVSSRQENITEIPKLKPAPKFEQKTESLKIKNETQSYDYSRLKAFFDPVSTFVFILCIILSLVIAFWGADKDENSVPISQTDSKSEEIIADIPSIDSYWDNSAPIKKVEQPKSQEPVKQEESGIVQLVEQVFKPQKAEPQKPKQPTVTPKVATVTPTPKVPAKTKTVTTTTASKVQPQKTPKITTTTTTTPQTKTNVPSQSVTDLTNRVKSNIQYTNPSVPSGSPVVKPSVSTSTSSKPQQQTQSQTQLPTQTQTQVTRVPAIRTNTSNTSTSTNSTKTQVQTQTTAPAVKTVDPAVAKQELANYKVSLRNAIGRKIDFTRVVGDGDCALSFKINSSGKLINRAFTKQSSNVTLNNAVYSAMNSTTSFNPPPSGYNNETLNLKIRFYNGNFEIYLN